METPNHNTRSPALNRRTLLRVGGAAMTVSGAQLLGACSFFSTSPGNKSSSSTADSASLNKKEAPMLSSKVSAGKLPELTKRIPEKPCVVTPYDSPGDYGGTIRSLWPATSPTSGVTPITSSRWVERDPKTLALIPSMMEGWEVSNDKKTYTFHIRKGLKWSDGEPYTTDDVMYVMKNVLLNTTLTPAYPTFWMSGGKPPKVTRIDDETFSFGYEQPASLLLDNIAFQGASLIQPMHYMKQFHPDFTNKTVLAKKAKAAGFQSWDLYYTNKASQWLNPDLPVMYPWMVTTPMSTRSGVAVFTRNPYYYKTDANGRQLPYVDKITYSLTSTNTEVVRISNGDFDLQMNDLQLKVSDLQLLASNQKKGNYTVNNWTSDTAFLVLYLNQYVKNDPVSRALLQNIKFRQALSIAINRDEINQALFNGQASTDQPTALPQDQYHVPGLGKRFTEYNVATANSLLDSLGLPRGSNGIRKRSDGKQLEFIIETFDYPDGIASASAVYEYVTRYWKAIGVKASVKLYDVAAWQLRMFSGEYTIGGYATVEYLWDIDPDWWVPDDAHCYWAPLYGQWHASGGKLGVEPPAEIKQLNTLYDGMKVAKSAAARTPLGQQIMKLHDHNAWIIGTVHYRSRPLIANADLINVRKEAVASYRLGHEEATRLEQLAYTNPSQHN